MSKVPTPYESARRRHMVERSVNRMSLLLVYSSVIAMLCIHIYIYMCIHIYIYIYTLMYVYIYIYICICITVIG